jgi:hypothetical protein
VVTVASHIGAVMFDAAPADCFAGSIKYNHVMSFRAKIDTDEEGERIGIQAGTSSSVN